MRCFAAISLPESVLDQMERLAEAVPLGRVPPRDNLHLTLAFFDELSPEQLHGLVEALGEIRHPAIEVVFGGLDLFGGARPVILHASVRSTRPLIHLHDKVISAARASGIELKRTRYRPHVTLARFNRAPKGAEAERLAAYLAANSLAELPPFEATDFSLFESKLGMGPARHSELARFQLGASSPA